MSTEALRAWVAADYGTIDSSEGNDQLAVVRFAEPDGKRARTLDEFREAAMGRAVVSLLGWRGFDLVIERVLAGEQPEPSRRASSRPRAWWSVARSPRTRTTCWRRRGRRRAPRRTARAPRRQRERRRPAARHSRAPDGRFSRAPDASASWREAYAEALLDLHHAAHRPCPPAPARRGQAQARGGRLRRHHRGPRAAAHRRRGRRRRGGGAGAGGRARPAPDRGRPRARSRSNPPS